MDTTRELTIDEIDGLVAERMREVQKSRVVGQFLAAARSDLGVQPSGGRWDSSKRDHHQIWLGKLLQFSKGSGLLRECDVIATRGQLQRMDGWCRKRWNKELSQLDGHDVTLEVEPVLGHDGRLKLKALRVLHVQEEGCWTRAKAAERSRLGSDHSTGGDAESRIRLRDVPSKITVIAPRRGKASRSDIRRILTTSTALAGISVDWSSSIGFTGRNAPRDIARAIRDAGTEGGLVLLTRGGGGPADFWPFETAEVAEAIRECRSLVVTALGHEEDHSLADDVADHCFAVPRAAADAIVSACDDLAKRRPGDTRRGRPGRSVAARQNQLLESQLHSARTSWEAAVAQRDGLRSELAAARNAERTAIAARDAAQAELGRRILQTLELDAGRAAITDVRDAVHLRYFSVLPAALAIFYGWACVIGADGAHRAVWGCCAALTVGVVVAIWATARHLAKSAAAAVSQRS